MSLRNFSLIVTYLSLSGNSLGIGSGKPAKQRSSTSNFPETPSSAPSAAHIIPKIKIESYIKHWNDIII